MQRLDTHEVRFDVLTRWLVESHLPAWFGLVRRRVSQTGGIVELVEGMRWPADVWRVLHRAAAVLPGDGRADVGAVEIEVMVATGLFEAEWLVGRYALVGGEGWGDRADAAVTVALASCRWAVRLWPDVRVPWMAGVVERLAEEATLLEC